MFLKKSTNSKTGRTYLSIVHSYWDSTQQKKRSKTIQSIGYLDELKKQYEDPIAHFTQIAKEMEENRQEETASVNFSFSKSETISDDSIPRKNFGYIALSYIYHSLGIHTFFINRQRHSKEIYSANEIMKLLVYGRLLFPGSKKKTYEQKNRFFDKMSFSMDDMYRCLSLFNKYKDNLQQWLNERIKKLYDRDSSLVYYDVTNYYFETDTFDDLKKKGVSKEHRPNPIVQMGLFIDRQGIPITYQLFPGNTNDCLTYRPNLSKMKKQYDLGKVVVVADKGMTTGDNIWYTLSAGDGYVFSKSVRKADQELKNYVLNQSGYLWLGDQYKRKSRLYPRTIQVTSSTGRKIKKIVDEKQVVFYSEKYAKKACYEREKKIEKALDLIHKPGKYNRTTHYGATGYIKNLQIDKETGEILSTTDILELDQERIKQEAALDGYYVLITSEYKEKDDAIIDMYRGLWKIEESFKVTKTDLEARPVYLSRHEHIKAHFLICFVALIIARILEMELNYNYSISRILESLSKAECSHLKENYYLFDYYDEILEKIGQLMSIDFDLKIRTQKNIKKILALSKK